MVQFNTFKTLAIARKNLANSRNLTLTNWTNLSSATATLMFVWSIIRRYAPYELNRIITQYKTRFFDMLSPYIHLYIEEFSSDQHLAANDIFPCIQAYLGENTLMNTRRLRLSGSKKGSPFLSSYDQEEVTEKFIWWTLKTNVSSSNKSTPYSNNRAYKVMFHRKYREIVVGEYMDHVINEGNWIRENKNRVRKLYLNRGGLFDSACSLWTHVDFHHPANFDSLAMDSLKKKEIIDDLLKFSKSRDYYARIGKPWKRGYLLYGPPGTGKSTMIAAMANLLGYNVYDLELTAVCNNELLRKLLISTASRSLIAIEDIDCSLELTGDRANKSTDGKKNVGRNGVTLSGLLNVIDGIWSSFKGERIVVFTTNSVSKLDPALIRTGRMDKHIELSYCCFEGFKVLAKNYLLLEAHPKFDVISSLLQEIKITPSDVAESLMPKDFNEDAERCLDNLILALRKAKEDQAAKAKALKLKKKKAAEESRTGSGSGSGSG